jgi:hypothetical protein
MSACCQQNVVPLKARHFRKAQSSLSGQKDKRVISAAAPGLPVGRGEQCVHFGAGEKTNKGASEAFAGDRQHALDLRRMGWHFKGCITKEGVNRSQPQVTAPGAQRVILFEMIEERHNQWRIDLFEGEIGWRLMQPLLAELEQLTERIPVGTNSVRTGLTLLH